MDTQSAKRTKRHDLDMLHGALWNKLPLFALPVAATAILEQLFNASDIAVVGNFTGSAKTAAVAAVGANSPIISLLVNLFVGIAPGANVVIANAIGREDREDVQKAVHTSIVTAVVCGIAVSILGQLVAASLLQSLQVPADVLPLALSYLRIYLVGMPVILLYNFEAAIFRSVGNTKVPLMVLALSGVLNVLLNLFFVIVLHMTVNGVAIATVISNGISAIVLFWVLTKTNQVIHVTPKKLGIDRAMLGHILKIGLPAGIQSAVFCISNIVIQSAINSLGKEVMAASSAAYNIEIMAYDVLNSFGQACTTFVGQNCGAGQNARCRKVLGLCIWEDAAISALFIAVILFFGKPLLSLFNSDPNVVALGYTRLVIVFFAYIFSLFYENLSGYLRGFGISLVPAILAAVGICVVRILWIETAFLLHRTFQTILIGYPISLGTTALLMGIATLVYRPSKKHETMSSV